MIVYRLARRKYIDDLTGKGAEIAGGRWNSKGVALLYTSESRALCTAEIAVHTPLGIIPKDYHLATIQIPEHATVLEFTSENLPPDWYVKPHSHTTQMIGDSFIRDNKYLVLKVPSVVVQGDHNFLINPRHPSFKNVKILKKELFDFDPRLFTR
jgi:RES domain-containing protein